MILLNSKEIEKALNIKIAVNFSIENISINSREHLKNNLFIPIKGNNFDGHDFILDAFKNGSTASLVEKKFLSKSNIGQIKDKIIIPVENSLESLQKLAEYSRNRIRKLNVICITGSSGKTTVKNWLSNILGNYYEIHSTVGNFNNLIGLPLSLSRMKSKTNLCILELGMNQKGEIKKLSCLAKPNISLITNIGPAHIGNFHNQKEIAIEKSNIFYGQTGGISLIPRDSLYYDLILKSAKQSKSKIYTFGYHKKSDFRILSSTFDDKKNRKLLKLKLMEKEVSFHNNFSGRIWEINFLIVFMVSKLIGINSEDILKKLKNLKPAEGRGSIHNLIFDNKKITLIDDSYNSNPLSLKNSIQSFISSPNTKGRKVCVIGDMLELGKNSFKYHHKIADILIKSNIGYVYTVGKESKIINKKLKNKVPVTHFENVDLLIKQIYKIFINYDLILIKGSNSIGLNKIFEKIKNCK